MDTEFMRHNTFYPQLALLQLGWQQHYALVDPLAFDIGASLQSRFSSQTGGLIMHSASEDLETLVPLLPEGPERLFDTQIAAALCGLGLGLSYRALVEQLIGVTLDKGETRSDWLHRPLSESQRSYATLDVVYLPPLHEQLQERLHVLGRLEWLAEEGQRLKERACRRSPDPQPQRSFRPAANWPLAQQALLRRLLLWREHTARSLDRPRSWLLDDALILQLVQQPNIRRQALDQRCKGLRALRQAQRDELHQQLQTPIEDAEVQTTQPVLRMLSEQHKRSLNAMRGQIEQQAQTLNIPAGLLCSRKVLEEYLLTRHWPAQLEGWRQPLLQPKLVPLLPD